MIQGENFRKLLPDFVNVVYWLWLFEPFGRIPYPFYLYIFMEECTYDSQ